MRLPLLIAVVGLCGLPTSAAELEVIVSPRVTMVARTGITGGGYPVFAGDRILHSYANHRDDFGGSFGTGSALSTDGGLTWTQGTDDWPLPKMIDLWADRLENGDLLAMGIHWTPDPAKRRDATPQKPPADAYQIAVSKDQGRSWTKARSVIDCPLEVGVVARPLPHIFQATNGDLLMPAYTWSRRGNRSVLLQSADRGRRWTVRSEITSAIAIIRSGVPISTPWLETCVAYTKNGDLLAIVRTGSKVKSRLVSVRSTDDGKTWGPPEKLPFAGKLPTLNLLPNGVLTLVTALSRNHTRLYLSADGTGRQWSRAYVISSLTGGNVGVTMADDNRLLVATPSNRRINAWNVRINLPAKPAPGLKAPTEISLKKGFLSWAAVPSAVAYRITPVLINPGLLYRDTEILRYATTQTRNATPRVELHRQLLPGSTYVFDIRSMDAAGKVSPASRSREIQF
ncbi:MAG: sialidase family protein [Verrucomicrobiia bacterium]|jgi:hypothetical protein